MARKKKDAAADATAAVYIPKAKGGEQSVGAAQDNTVVVALCHPHGITFRLGDRGEHEVRLNGNAANLKGLSMGVLPLGGFGLTTVKAEEWEAIKRQVQDWPLYKNGLLYAHEKTADVTAEADEKAELRHGREPVQVDGDERQTNTAPAEKGALA